MLCVIAVLLHERNQFRKVIFPDAIKSDKNNPVSDLMLMVLKLLHWALLNLSLLRPRVGQNKTAALRTIIRAYLTALCHSKIYPFKQSAALALIPHLVQYRTATTSTNLSQSYFHFSAWRPTGLQSSGYRLPRTRTFAITASTDE